MPDPTMLTSALAAVRDGYRATPVEARYLADRLREAGFCAWTQGAPTASAPGPGGPG